MLSAPGRKPPRHVFCAQLQEMALLSWSSAKRFHLGKKGACGRLGAVHCPAVAAMRGLLGRAPKSYPGSGPFVTRKDSPISELRNPRVSTEFRSSQVRGSEVRSSQMSSRIPNLRTPQHSERPTEFRISELRTPNFSSHFAKRGDRQR